MEREVSGDNLACLPELVRILLKSATVMDFFELRLILPLTEIPCEQDLRLKKILILESWKII